VNVDPPVAGNAEFGVVEGLTVAVGSDVAAVVGLTVNPGVLVAAGSGVSLRLGVVLFFGNNAGISPLTDKSASSRTATGTATNRVRRMA
jgi:hypothetical protein